MQQLLSFWSVLDLRRRVITIVATLAMFAAVLALTRMAATPSQALLYAGLEPAAAGEVIRALEQRGTAHSVRGDSIWVDARQRDELRMALAADGLPANGGAGYELLDQLSGFGTTAQMFDAAYLRAKEGELARTIAASAHVRNARVHLAVPAAQPFRRDHKPSASVTVTSISGAFPPVQAQAIRHLVSSAVAGMAPGDVAVIDSVSGLVRGVPEEGSLAGEARGEELKRAVERLLAARVGPGRALVELTVDLVTERESISERRFDPQGRVMISSENEARSTSSSGAAPGVTVASNLPEGDAANGAENRSQDSQTRERINYEVSETAREILRSPGGIRRLTVAVLVDGIRAADGSWQARTDAELADLRDLVASATGFDSARGDVLTIKSLEFEPLPDETGAAGPGLLSGLDLMALIQMAVIAVLVLAIAIFVVRPLLRPARRPEVPAPTVLPSIPPPDSVLTGEIDDHPGLPAPPHRAGDHRQADHVERLRQLISERQAESVEILRSWMDEREETRP